MAQSFNCPNCGAGLEYGGSGKTMECQYCNTNVPVPEELWAEQEKAKTLSQLKKYMIIFLAITVGLPTCVGLIGALVGIGGSIIAVILPIILKLFVG